jgi:hypothetical protein
MFFVDCRNQPGRGCSVSKGRAADDLESLKLAVEGGRTTAGVEARPVVRQKTTEEVVHRLLGCQPEPKDLPALAVNDHTEAQPASKQVLKGACLVNTLLWKIRVTRVQNFFVREREFLLPGAVGERLCRL